MKKYTSAAYLNMVKMGNVYMGLYAPEKMRDRVLKAANKRGVSMSQWIREAVAEALMEEGTRR